MISDRQRLGAVLFDFLVGENLFFCQISKA